ncbi:MAG: hypothetical protein P4N59_15510 [Negativicutes bacterium]|nr:hypothetical protein [Negativicutes bacterium]
MSDIQIDPKMNHGLVFDLALWAGWAKASTHCFESHSALAVRATSYKSIRHAVILQGFRVLYRAAHPLSEELADATLDTKRKQSMEAHTTVPSLIIDDLGWRLPPLRTPGLYIRSYQSASTLHVSNWPIEDGDRFFGR